jgi:ABC-2 type transport system permease protein
VRGLDPVLGQSISSTARSRLTRSPVELEPILGVFYPLDLGFVVEVLAGLLVLMLTYDAVCGEKERGTLRLTGSFRVRKPLLLLAKGGGALVPAFAIFGLPLLLGIAVLTSLPTVQFSGDEWVRLGGILGTFAAYLVTSAAAGLLASSLSSRSSTAFILVLAYWIVSVAVLPRLSLILSDTVRSAPSRYEHTARLQAVGAEFSWKSRDEHKVWWGKQASARPGWPGTPEQKEEDMYHFHATGAKYSAMADEAYGRIDEEFRNGYSSRLQLAASLARLSPAFALRSAVMRLAGTGIDRSLEFERTYKDRYWRGQYQPWFRQFANKISLQRARPEKHGEPVWTLAEFPRFSYVDRPPEVFEASIYDIGTLCLLAVSFVAGASVVMLRYDVR